MLALLTNDDGINAKGLLSLKREISKIGQVWVVAPDREQSATSHSLTLQYPLRINKIADKLGQTWATMFLIRERWRQQWKGPY